MPLMVAFRVVEFEVILVAGPVVAMGSGMMNWSWMNCWNLNLKRKD